MLRERLLPEWCGGDTGYDCMYVKHLFSCQELIRWMLGFYENIGLHPPRDQRDDWRTSVWIAWHWNVSNTSNIHPSMPSISSLKGACVFNVCTAWAMSDTNNSEIINIFREANFTCKIYHGGIPSLDHTYQHRATFLTVYPPPPRTNRGILKLLTNSTHSLRDRIHRG